MSHGRLFQLLGDMKEQNLIAEGSKLLYVDDGSRDDTWEIIQKLSQENNAVAGVKLSCNSGHQNALMAGLAAAVEHSDITVSIDADLQDDINVIPQMVGRYMEGCDIVFGVRRERKSDTWFKRNTARVFYSLMKIDDFY